VEQALAQARAAAARAGGPGGAPSSAGSRGGRWLALIPLTAAFLVASLVMPRAAEPEDIPLPRIDLRALDAVRVDDVARAASARTTRLPSDVLLVGTALRAVNLATTSNTTDDEVQAARVALDAAVRQLLADRARATESLRTLRAVQLETFLAEVARFESDGVIREELLAVAGGFVDRMHAAGWLEGTRVVLDDSERRAAYKLVWTAQVGADRDPQLALSLDEQRALYTLYLRRPHAPEAQRPGHAARRASAREPEECRRAAGEEQLAMDQWRLEKIKRLGEIDPTYPTAYALGVAYFRVGRYDASMEAFQAWIARHPDGPLGLRARNHLKAALLAYGPT
jgi:tetratricopeptide (TPR) repeat protein